MNIFDRYRLLMSLVDIEVALGRCIDSRMYTTNNKCNIMHYPERGISVAILKLLTTVIQDGSESYCIWRSW